MNGLSPREAQNAAQDVLDDAATALEAHRHAHGCNTGSGCAEGRDLAVQVTQSQAAHGLTRFIGEDDEGSGW